MTTAKQSLLEVAKAVVKDWDNHRQLWEGTSEDASAVELLRQAVQGAQDVQVYTPMTDDDRRKITQEACSYKTLALNVERAVIKRLGMRWPE